MKKYGVIDSFCFYINPSPPKACFATSIAKAAPSTHIHVGELGGNVSASNTPVTAALPSLTALVIFRMRQARSSKTMHANACFIVLNILAHILHFETAIRCCSSNFTIQANKPSFNTNAKKHHKNSCLLFQFP